jgi:hypothetical protein
MVTILHQGDDEREALPPLTRGKQQTCYGWSVSSALGDRPQSAILVSSVL